MFRNYLKTAWRNIIKDKGYTTFNVMGLAIGMAVAFMIGLWVQYQFSYDRFLLHYQQAYRTMVKGDYNGEMSAGNATCLPLP